MKLPWQTLLWQSQITVTPILSMEIELVDNENVIGIFYEAPEVKSS